MDTLSLDKPLRTAEPLVQLATDLAAGDYTVQLLVVDALGAQAVAQLSFALRDRPERPPIRPTPVDRPPVTEPRERPVGTPAPRPAGPTPAEPRSPRAPRSPRPVAKRPKPPGGPADA